MVLFLDLFCGPRFTFYVTPHSCITVAPGSVPRSARSHWIVLHFAHTHVPHSRSSRIFCSFHFSGSSFSFTHVFCTFTLVWIAPLDDGSFVCVHFCCTGLDHSFTLWITFSRLRFRFLFTFLFTRTLCLCTHTAPRSRTFTCTFTWIRTHSARSRSAWSFFHVPGSARMDHSFRFAFLSVSFFSRSGSFSLSVCSFVSDLWLRSRSALALFRLLTFTFTLWIILIIFTFSHRFSLPGSGFSWMVFFRTHHSRMVLWITFVCIWIFSLFLSRGSHRSLAFTSFWITRFASSFVCAVHSRILCVRGSYLVRALGTLRLPRTRFLSALVCVTRSRLDAHVFTLHSFHALLVFHIVAWSATDGFVFTWIWVTGPGSFAFLGCLVCTSFTSRITSRTHVLSPLPGPRTRCFTAVVSHSAFAPDTHSRTLALWISHCTRVFGSRFCLVYGLDQFSAVRWISLDRVCGLRIHSSLFSFGYGSTLVFSFLDGLRLHVHLFHGSFSAWIVYWIGSLFIVS